MATKNGDLNIPLQIDEALLGPIFVVASAVQAKVATISRFGVGLSSNFYTVGSTSITWAAALAVGALIAAYFLYEVELGKLDQTQTLAAVATVTHEGLQVVVVKDRVGFVNGHVPFRCRDCTLTPGTRR